MNIFIYYIKEVETLKNYLSEDNQELNITNLIKGYLQCMFLPSFSYRLNIVYQIIKEKLHHIQFFFCPPGPIERKNNFKAIR